MARRKTYQVTEEDAQRVLQRMATHSPIPVEGRDEARRVIREALQANEYVYSKPLVPTLWIVQ